MFPQLMAELLSNEVPTGLPYKQLASSQAGAVEMASSQVGATEVVSQGAQRALSMSKGVTRIPLEDLGPAVFKRRGGPHERAALHPFVQEDS